MKTATEYLADIAAALEMGPQTWHYDSNMTPFYNDADGHSRGGDADGSFCLFGEPFEIEGEAYEAPVLVERCGEADAAFISACHPAALRSILEEREQTAIAFRIKEAECERLKAQLAEARKDAARWRKARELARHNDGVLTFDGLPWPSASLPKTADYADAAIDAMGDPK